MMTPEATPLVAPSRPSTGRPAAPLLAACIGAAAGMVLVLAMGAGQPSAQFTAGPTALRSAAMAVPRPAPIHEMPSRQPPSRVILQTQAPPANFKPNAAPQVPPTTAPSIPMPRLSVPTALGLVGAAAVLAWWAMVPRAATGAAGVVAMAAAQGTKGDGDRRQWPKDPEGELAELETGRRTPIGRLRNRVNSLFGRRLAELEAFRMDPFSLADQLLADVQAEFQDFRTTKDALWHPSVDVRETPQAITFHCDLPGIAKENIQIDLTRDRLTISGKREKHSERQPAADAKEGWQYTERSFGAFSRSFAVPPGTTRKDVSAAYKDGVLEVTVKKQPPPKEEDTRIVIE